VWLLVSLDKDYDAAGSETPWPHFYAERILEHFASRSDGHPEGA
jgi:hypothetical protein